MILVLGANGQLGYEFKRILGDKAIFLDRKSGDLSDLNAVHELFSNYKFSVLINAAAYTLVDKAEEEKELAFKINAEAPKLLGQLCFKNKIQLIHFSTDYVFDGKSETHYVEADNILPINTYGESKAMGEKYVSQENPLALIIRTSWVYSSHGHNFVKTMIKYGKEREELKVVDDQFGAPTWAHELAKVTLQAIDKNLSGVYHFSNEGKCSWYEFALEIKKLTNFKAIITPIPSKEYQTNAVRPKFSLLCKDKIKRDLIIEIPDWKDSLKSMIREVL